MISDRDRTSIGPADQPRYDGPFQPHEPSDAQVSDIAVTLAAFLEKEREANSGSRAAIEAQIAQVTNRMLTFFERADERKDLGRALVEERARNLDLERRLFTLEQRALEAERKLVQLSELGQLIDRSVLPVRRAISDAHAAAQSLARSRVLRSTRFASAAPLSTAERITSALGEASEGLKAVEQACEPVRAFVTKAPS